MLRAHFEAAPASDYVFPAPQGGPIRYSAFLRRTWHAALEASGIGHVTPHGLRHTNVAWQIKAGVQEHVIVKRMGWRNSQMLHEVYGHVFDDQHIRVADRLAEMYERPFADPVAAASQTRPAVVALDAERIEEAI